MSPRAPVHEKEIGPVRTARRRKRKARAAKERRKPRARKEAEVQSFRFDDPYWDDAFNSYYDPTLRTCCRI